MKTMIVNTRLLKKQDEQNFIFRNFFLTGEITYPKIWGFVQKMAIIGWRFFLTDKIIGEFETL